MDIMEILGKIDNSVLSEESKAQIQGVFESIVTEKVDAIVNEKVESAVQKALQEQDDSHAEQLEKLLVAIDEDHSAKLTTLVQRLDEDHSAKLQEIVEHYESTINNDAKKLAESLSNDISNFLDLTLDEVLPKDMLEEAVKNTKAIEMIQRIKEVVSVDPEYINEHIKEALIEGKQQIEALREDLNEVLKENVKLATERSRFEAELILEKKAASLPAEKRKFLVENFKGKSAEFIKDNFDATIKLFERKEQEERKTEKNFIITESVARTVDTPKDRGAVKTSNSNSYVEDYVSGLK
jgi:hypothetical protein